MLLLKYLLILSFIINFSPLTFLSGLSLMLLFAGCSESDMTDHLVELVFIDFLIALKILFVQVVLVVYSVRLVFFPSLFRIIIFFDIGDDSNCQIITHFEELEIIM